MKNLKLILKIAAVVAAICGISLQLFTSEMK